MPGDNLSSVLFEAVKKNEKNTEIIQLYILV